MLKTLLLFAIGYFLYKLFRFNQLLFGKKSHQSREEKEKSSLGIRDEDIREADFSDIEEEH
ncbi:MAG: hypothetical protein QF674_05345 [Candidatus Marinimicrobia bacterium]|jgi:hypothetical protein|nr:hypothetical protein [Candidatus Neomarinimicrobiota bacterium]MDP7483677.1 hypothetical protein [Candidatus Neomarinimicrobiota bacterium]MDP7716131.1 hypothetical protein [Candidatus Neomarinimicrobiota bacterium]HJM10460.1 hypothetical protein [Candidatus Neomarinimicrobiota bacterium]|tara:strand:+ start:998 stop:1180 length:183 start_codon:yes stop_codon:yes gene_type:complete